MGALIYDVIVVGGGLAGCAAALAICKSDPSATFLLVDDADPMNFKIGESLPPEASRLLHLLDPSLPKSLASQCGARVHYTCTGNASSWASTEIEERHSIMNPFGHGWHLDRAAFDELIRASLDQGDDSTSRRVVKGNTTKVEKDEDGLWYVHVDARSAIAPTEYHSKWIVDATGRKASVATKLGAKIIKPQPLLSFYAVFEASTFLDATHLDKDNRTFIEAVPEGWFYSSLVPSPSESHTTTRVVAFHTQPNHPSAKLARRQDGFLDLLHSTSTHISSIIQKYEYELPPGRSFPICTAAGTSYLDKPIDTEDRWIAVGDAAMAFDPLSSQGMMTALEMGYCVGMLLGARLLAPGYNGAYTGLEQIYGKVRSDYQKARAYYYSLGKTRFKGEQFWDTV